jgi:hypothetical protein
MTGDPLLPARPRSARVPFTKCCVVTGATCEQCKEQRIRALLPLSSQLVVTRLIRSWRWLCTVRLLDKTAGQFLQNFPHRSHHQLGTDAAG